jgi:hypothetical protein
MRACIAIREADIERKLLCTSLRYLRLFETTYTVEIVKLVTLVKLCKHSIQQSFFTDVQILPVKKNANEVMVIISGQPVLRTPPGNPRSS